MVNLTAAIEMTPEVEAAVDDMFIYHEWNDDQKSRGANVRQALCDAVKCIIINVPPSADRSSAIRKIREAAFTANSAITSGGKF